MKNLITLLSGQTWRKVKNRPGCESAEFEYQCSGRKRPGRFAPVRKLIEVITEGVIFPEYVYGYFCYVTNENLTPWQAHKKYGKRAAGENWTERCRNQMAAGTILTENFRANSAIFQTCIPAYNLTVWMMRLGQKRKIYGEPDTVRFWLIHVPGRF